eukprot:NODE_740_length_4671_cov_0.215879.p2 type:complete len:315 gc:universal NODE_740_length_4671_cov_0.215879:109-1053(+)
MIFGYHHMTFCDVAHEFFKPRFRSETLKFMDLYLYIIFGLLTILVAMGFSMLIMYYKYVLRKRWDARASCIEMATDTINENIKQELSDITLDADSIEEPEKEKTLIQQIQHPKEHPITQQPLPEDIHDLFNPKLQPRNGALVQFTERDLLSFPKTALSGNEMIKEIKLQEHLSKRDNNEEDVPLEIIRRNSCKRVGRSVVKFPNTSREHSRESRRDEIYAGSRYSSRNQSRVRSASRARSEVDDRHSKFENPIYKTNKDFEDYYLKFIVPTISAVVQQTLAQTMNPNNKYVDQWVNNHELASIDGLQTPSLKSL